MADMAATAMEVMVMAAMVTVVMAMADGDTLTTADTAWGLATVMVAGA